MGDQPKEESKTEDSKTEDSKTEDSKKSVSRIFTPEDIKLLVITFASTVAANVVTVLFVALAIVTARSYKREPKYLPPTKDALATKVFSIATSLKGETVVFIVAIAFIFYMWRRAHSRDLFKVMLPAFILCIAFPVLFVLLVWVGIAAGIK